MKQNPSSYTLAGKRALVVGLANKESVAAGVIQALIEAGMSPGDIFVTYQNDDARRFCLSVLQKYNIVQHMPFDVTIPGDMDRLVARLGTFTRSGMIDTYVHSIAWGSRGILARDAIDHIGPLTDDFLTSLRVSAISFPDIANRLLDDCLMIDDGEATAFCMSYLGATHIGGVESGYGLMSTVKLVLEGLAKRMTVRGRVRVHVISPDTIATRAAKGIPAFAGMLEHHEQNRPLSGDVTNLDVGHIVALLAMDAAKSMTGGTMMVDGGYHATV